MISLYYGQDSNSLDRLQDWLEKVAERQPPVYKIKSFSVDYSWMDLKDNDNEIKLQTPDIFAEAESQNEIFNSLSDKEYKLVTPASIRKLNRQWSKVIYHRERSFPWDERGWIEFLEKTPQCFDSIEIINDILMALEEWQQEKDVLENISLPLAQRAWQIYESLPEQGGMPTRFSENESLYLALSSIILILKQLGQNDGLISYYERLIIINPTDILGLRGGLAHEYLAQKEYDKFFNLLRIYSRDVSLDFSMAKVLALWATGDIDAAKKQWSKVKKYNSHIKKYLLKNDIAMPKITYEITVGGEDEAWLYRNVARDIWLEHKGALDWLKQN